MNASSQGQQQPASSQPPPLQHGFQPTILHPQQANSSNSNDVTNNHFNSFNLNHTPSNVIDDAFLLPDHLYLALNSSNDHSTSLSQSAIEPNPHHHPHTFPANTFAQHTSHSSHFPTINAANDLFQQQQQQQQNFGQLSAHSADADVWMSHGLTAPNTNSNSNSNSSAAASGYATPMVISSQGGRPGLNMGASTGSAGLATPSTNSFSFDPVAGSAHLHLPPARCIHETEEQQQQQQQQQLPNSLTPTDTRPSAAQDFLNANAISQKSALNQDQQGMQLHQPARPQAISPVTTNPKLGDSVFSNFSPSVSSYHAYGHSPSQHTSSSVGAGPNGIDLGAGASTPATSIVSLGSSMPQSFSNHGHTLMHQSAHQHGLMHMPGSSGMFERQASQQQAPFQQQQFQQQQQQQQSQQMQAQQAHQSFNGIPSSVPPSFHFGLPTTANALQQQQNGQDGASNGTIMIPTLHSPMGAAPNSAAAISQSASKHRRHKSSTSTSPVNIRRAKERSQSRNRASMAAHGHAGSAAGSAASATGSTLGKRNSPAISVGAHGFDEDAMLRDGHAELEIAGGGSVGKAPSSRARVGRRSSIGPAAKAAGARGRSGSNASRPGLSNPVQHSQSQPGASPASPSTEGSIRQPTSPTNVFPTGSFLHQAVIAGVESGASSAHESPLSSSAHNSNMQHQQYNHPYGMMMMNNAHGTTTTGSNASSLFEGSVGGGAGGGGGSMFIPHQQPQQGQNPTAATTGAPGSASSSTAHLQAQQQFAFRSASASLSPASSTGDGVEANANVPNPQQQQFQGFPTHHHLHMHRFPHHHHHHLPSASLQSVVEESGGTSANVSGVMMAPASSGDVTMQSLVKRERDGTSLDHDMESSSSLLQNRSSGAATGDGDGAEVFDYDAAEDDGDEDFVDEEDEDEEGESEGEDTRRGVRRGSQGGRRPSKQQQQQQRNDDTHDDDHAHSDVETGGGGVHKISSSSKGPQVSKASRSTTAAAAAKKTTTTTRAKAGGARDDQATAHTAAAGKEDLSKATKGRKRAVSTAKRESVSIPPSTPSSSTAAPFKTSSKNAGGVGNPANGDSRAMQVSSQMDELAEQGRGNKVELGEASKQGVGKKVRVSAKDKDPEAEAKRLAERRRRRRESHNAVERRRRDNINEKITELATLLPEAMLVEAIATSTSGGNSGNFDIAAAVKTLESASAGVAAAAARLGGSGFGHGLSSSSHHAAAAAAAAAAGSKSIHGGENEGDEDEGNFLAGLLPPLMHELHGEDGDQLDNGQTAGANVGASAGTGAMMLLSPQTALAGLPSLSISGGETTMQDDNDQTGKQAMLYPNNILSGYGSSSSTGIQAAAAASAVTSSSVALPLSDGMSLAMSTAIPRHISSWAAAQAAAAKDPSAAMTNPTLAYAAALAPVHRDSAALAAAQAKPNKGIILRKSVDYIRHLQQFLDMQMGINRVLENEVLALRRCVAGSGHGGQQEHQMSSPPAQQPQYQQVRSQPLTKLASNLPIQDGQRSSSTNQTRPMDASAIFGTVEPFSTQGSGMDDSTASAAAAAAVDMMASGPGLGSNGTTHRGRRASPLPTVAPADSGIGASNLDRWLNFDMRTGLPRRPSLEPLADRMLGTDHSDTSPGADAGPMLASSTAFDPTMGDNGDEPLMSSHAPDLQRKGRDQKRSAHHQQQQHVGQPVSQPMATSHSASAAITTTAPPVEVERGRSRTRSFHPALPVGLGAGSQSSVPTQEGSWPELKASAALSRATSQDRVPSARMTPAGFGSQSRVASLGRMGNPSSPPLASFSDHSLGGGGHAGFTNLHRQGSMLGFVGLGLDDLFGQQSQSQSQHSSGAEGGNGSGGNTNHTSGGLVAMEE
ncbi:hypothetical protein OC845_004099 [Tilletia horrida]|nr:hypothetical protein OC845_004099 [Tilletia horrida]